MTCRPVFCPAGGVSRALEADRPGVKPPRAPVVLMANSSAARGAPEPWMWTLGQPGSVRQSWRNTAGLREMTRVSCCFSLHTGGGDKRRDHGRCAPQTPRGA